jgi:putative serine protease PepD
VISKAGYIITNYHVIAGANKERVSFSDGEDLAAHVVGKDPSTDIAVLKVDAKSRALKPLPLGNSDALQVGDAVVAIGNPLGYTRSITSGIVSALGRPIYAPNGFQIDHVIQTDAALNHGNSGGPLLNAQGEVVGVNSQIASSGGSDANIGIGFAIPINTVREVVGQLIQSGRAQHAFIGIGAQPLTPDVAKLFHLPIEHGLLVQSVCGGSGAAKAGIRAGTKKVTVAGETWTIGGDIITKVDGVSIESIDRLRDLVQRKRPGDSLKVELYRGNERSTRTVKLGQQPTSARTC